MLLPFLVSFIFFSKYFHSVFTKCEKLFTASRWIYFMHWFGNVPWKSRGCCGMMFFPRVSHYLLLISNICSREIVIFGQSYLNVFYKSGNTSKYINLMPSFSFSFASSHWSRCSWFYGFTWENDAQPFQCVFSN